MLIDTDAFCKLAVGGILTDAVELLGTHLEGSARLPALPHMLRRGKLAKVYGEEVCSRLLSVANSIPVMPDGGEHWQEKLRQVPGIDPGEARLFAVAAEHGWLVLSGDKRAVRALKTIESIHGPLNGRIVMIEPMLLALHNKIGSADLQSRMQPLLQFDQSTRACFSGSDPVAGLLAYTATLVSEVHPLVLWAGPAMKDSCR